MNPSEARSNSTPDSSSKTNATANSYRESHDSSGALRPHWKAFYDAMTGLGNQELNHRWNTGKRILRNHGVSYNVSAHDGTRERPWELDLVPFLINQDEWTHIQKGVIQRAHLLNQILEDIYSGPQRLLRNGLIPPALIFANPSFLRCCRGIPHPGNVHLHLHAVDLARAPDGQWWVLDTRVQSPKGLGYTIENRNIIGRILGDVFQGLQVTPLTGFFDIIRRQLMEFAPTSTGWPRTVLLTAGTQNPAHYEQAMLARYLGYTLAQGSDLTVRDNKVHLKTVEGPQAVDAIIRHVDDLDCDPLELRSDSFLGVPGLVQAARAGKVLLANTLGSAIVETPALQSALPEIAQHLLGEALHLPNAPTWWCGDAEGKPHVLNQLETLIVKNAFPSSERQTMSGMEMASDEHRSLRKQIRERPYEYVGQQPIELSHSPVWQPDTIDERPIVLRVFVAADRDSFVVLPGGLTKVSASRYSPVKGFQLAGGSKDTWVLPLTAHPSTKTPIKVESRPAARLETGVPSRVADHLYWLGRYTERLGYLIQILKSITSRLANAQEPRVIQQASVLTEVLGEIGFEVSDPQSDSEATVIEIIYSPKLTTGVHALCQNITSIVHAVRDRFSGDAWGILNQVRSFPGPRPKSLPLASAQNLIHQINTTLAALAGIEAENMVRDHEWRFLSIGRRLERAQNLCELITHFIEHTQGLELLLNPLLEISDTSMSYRRQYYSQPEAKRVMESLLLDDQNPRALKFNLNQIQALCTQLPSTGNTKTPEARDASIKRIKRTLNTRSLAQINGPKKKAARLKEWYALLTSVSDSLTHQYFSLLKP